MIANRLFFLVLFGLLVVGCSSNQPATPPSTTQLPSVTVLPTAVVASPTALPSLLPSPEATGRPAIPYIPSAKPTTLPSATPAPTLAAGVPTLEEFASEFNKASNRAFNDTRKVYLSAENVWVIDNPTSSFKYTIFIRPSKARSFGAFDTVWTVYGAGGTAKSVSLDEGDTGSFYEYSLVMKCYDARYDVELFLLDYVTQPGGTTYRRTLGPAVMLTLADACPN